MLVLRWINSPALHSFRIMALAGTRAGNIPASRSTLLISARTSLRVHATTFPEYPHTHQAHVGGERSHLLAKSVSSRALDNLVQRIHF
jgi:hypothetical protein